MDVRATQFESNRNRGIGSYVGSLIEGLLEAPSRNEYILFTLPGMALPASLEVAVQQGRCRSVPLATALIAQDTLFQRLPRVWRLSYLWRERQHRRQLSRAARRERLDILHLTVPIDPRLFSDCGRDGGRRYRVVKTAYDMTPWVMKDQFFLPGSGKSWFTYERQLSAYRNADAVVAISGSAGDDFVRLGHVDRTKVHVVPCGIPEKFRTRPDSEQLAELRTRHGLRRPYFLFCSGANPNKNRRRVVEAFGTFLAGRADPNVELIFVGPDSDHDMGELKRVAFDSGVTRDQFRMLGFVSEEELRALFAGAIALVTPSLYEGFGLPAAEAMLLGVPVLASDRSSHPEVVGDAGLLVNPYEATAIAAAMTRLADDAPLRHELGRRGIERARRYSVTAQTAQLLHVYAGLTAQDA